MFNLGAFLLPALYGTLSKMWIAGIDSSFWSLLPIHTRVSTLVQEVYSRDN
jgi:hypothetical protein